MRTTRFLKDKSRGSEEIGGDVIRVSATRPQAIRCLHSQRHKDFAPEVRLYLEHIGPKLSLYSCWPVVKGACESASNEIMRDQVFCIVFSPLFSSLP
ncbi:hypothetical protein E2C01_083218 [Portunus trituberculatus]|uniref:Uncharacterized protein n=1 Tax=Portunus trituberculatus TaxID=210409 RepID=A0A5B7J3X5_PORTR|nr:hypothetical protein [Portunus trituberculatus]